MRITRLIAMLAVINFSGTLYAQSPTGQKPARMARAATGVSALVAAQRVEMGRRDRINSWTVGLAGGFIEGAPLRLAAEIARVVNDGDNLHVLPIVTGGATENVNSLLYLKGIDAAIINIDALDEYKTQVPTIDHRLVYILNLFPSELHIFVRPEIQSLEDLRGKKVNFNSQGTAAAYTGPLIFSRLGLDIEKMFIPHQVALPQMRNGEISAVVFVTSKPVDAFLKGRWDPGFKFLQVGYDSKFEDYYLPSFLEPTDYPNLVPQGQRIATLAVPTILASFNWAPQSDRYRRVARLVDNLFGRLDKLQSPGFDPKWKEVNLRAMVPTLERFRPAQEWLNRPQAATAGEAR
ncbi:MAG: TAXI family TRAP transporter solute-binding subunit [Afipia sp.]